MEAVRLYQMAIDNNEHEYTAVYNLGDCYFNGEGVVKDYEEGLRLYIKAAEMGYPIAMYRLGDCYYNGEGVVKDYGEAFKWYYKSAERNYPRGQYRTGWCYYYGVGVSVDYNEAYEYFRKAAEKNDPDALYMQGLCCFNEKDYKFAVYCYELAVKAGLKEDIYNYYKTAKIKSYFIR
jgi:hypothetical protein